MTATLTGTAISTRRRDAILVKNGQRHAVHARTASAAEKAELWPKIVASASRLMRAANSKPRSVSLGKTAKLIRYAGSPGISERRARGRCGEPGVLPTDPRRPRGGVLADGGCTDAVPVVVEEPAPTRARRLNRLPPSAVSVPEG